MASIYYAIDRVNGDGSGRVYTGTASQSKEIEIAITTGVGVTRKQAKLACERLIRYFAEEDTASALSG